MANDKRLCRIPYELDGVTQEYDFSPRDITVARLNQMSAWYGPDYGKYLTFVQLFLQGDAQAIACALWIVLSKNGVNRRPQVIDFPVVEIFDAIQRQNEEDVEAALAADTEPDPLGRAGTETTSD